MSHRRWQGFSKRTSAGPDLPETTSLTQKEETALLVESGCPYSRKKRE